MNRKLSGTTLLAFVMVALGACSAGTQGTPGPVASTTTAQNGTGSVSTTTDTGDPLASVDPCTLLDPALLSQNQLVKSKSGIAAGARFCDWVSGPTATSVGYSVSVNVYDHAGLGDLSTAGFSITDHAVGQHQGRLSTPTAGDTCVVSMEMSPTSRVDVVGADGAAVVATSCKIATLIAPSVEHQLPPAVG